MANIVLGIGTSHTPMLLASDETLPRFLETDQIIKLHDKEGRPAMARKIPLQFAWSTWNIGNVLFGHR